MKIDKHLNEIIEEQEKINEEWLESEKNNRVISELRIREKNARRKMICYTMANVGYTNAISEMLGRIMKEKLERRHLKSNSIDSNQD